jgi:hypothetical protein
MPGGRSRAFHLGDRAELLVENLLCALAFTTPVPRSMDIGFDFFCSLISQERGFLKAGPFFTVQAKSSKDRIVYKKEHQLSWLTSLENPLLLCVADRKALAMSGLRWTARILLTTRRACTGYKDH